MKHFYLLLIAVLAATFSFTSQAQRTVFFVETCGTGTGTVKVPDVSTWYNPNLVATAWSSDDDASMPDIRTSGTTSLNKGFIDTQDYPGDYTQRSGGRNLFFDAKTNVAEIVVFSNIDASQFTDLELSFGYFNSKAGEIVVLDIEYFDGSNWQPIAYEFPATNDKRIWYRSPIIPIPADVKTNPLQLRFTKPKTSALGLRMDDIWISGVPKFEANAVAKEATDVGTTGFTAQWEAYPGATGYLLEISDKEDFLQEESVDLATWNYSAYTENDIGHPYFDLEQDLALVHVASANNLDAVIKCSADRATNRWNSTADYKGVTGWNEGLFNKSFNTTINTLGFHNLFFKARLRGSESGPRHMRFQYRLSDESDWIDIPNSDTETIAVKGEGTASEVPHEQTTNLPSACWNQPEVQIRWTPSLIVRATGWDKTAADGDEMIATAGASRFRHFLVRGSQSSLIEGKERVTVEGTSYQVSGLEAGKDYYYRVRATDGKQVSAVSETKSTRIGTGIANNTVATAIAATYNRVDDCFAINGLSTASPATVYISDTNGRLLAKQVLTESGSISAAALQKGIYLVSVLTAEGKQSFKCRK